MANEILSTTVAADQRKAVAAKLLQRAHLKLVAASICDRQKQEKGTGTQTTFIRYKRMFVPLTVLSEGVTPANSTIQTETVVSNLDQWGDYVIITDVARYTTLHPLAQIAQDLLADNAQRVIDREVQLVMLAGTTVQYGDGSVTSRATIAQAMKITDKIIHKATLTMENAGAQTREGPSNMREQAQGGSLSGSTRGSGHYVMVTGGEVVRDIQSTAVGSSMWAAYHQYQDKMDLYNGEVGLYLGVRFVGSNFLPRFSRLGNKTANTTIAVGATATDAGGVTGMNITHAAAGGAIANTVILSWKLTRIDLTRGFEEAITIGHTVTVTAMAGATNQFTFVMPSTAGYVYRLYINDTSNNTSDATYRLVGNNLAASSSTVITALPAASGTNPPASLKAAGDATDPDNVYPCFLIANQALAWVGLQDLQVLTTGEAPDKADPLAQRSTIGYKFMAKACILDQTRLLRLELPSDFF